MNHGFTKVFALSSLVLASQLASASVVLLQDNRSVNDQQPATPFTHWVNDLQNSQVTTALMQGTGSGYSYYWTFYGELTVGRSVFDVQFRADQQQAMTLSATLTAGPQSCGFCSSSSFHLWGPAGFDTVTGLAQSIHTSAAGDVTYYGMNNLNISTVIDLMPGEYRLLFATENWWGDGASTWSFNASFSEVPVPAAGWMMMSAIASLGAARRLRQRKK